jgi:hypothetical protein
VPALIAYPFAQCLTGWMHGWGWMDGSSFTSFIFQPDALDE